MLHFVTPYIIENCICEWLKKEAIEPTWWPWLFLFFRYRKLFRPSNWFQDFFSLDRESTYVDFFCMAWKIPACWDWISWSNLLRVMKNYRRPPACGWLFVEEIIHRRCPRSWDPDRPANLGNNFSNPIIIRLRWGCYTCQVAVSYSVVMGRTMFNVQCPFDWILK